jgi:hypothetical protein
MRLLQAFPKFWVKFLHTFVADAMTEISFWVPTKIMLNRMPYALSISDAFAV